MHYFIVFLRVFIFLLALFPTSSYAALEHYLESEHFTLQNGMEVVVISNHKVPAVSHMVWYKVGGIDEQPGKSGIAHFLEHLMFKGTEKFGPGEFSSNVAHNGGNDNAFTSQDYTAYYQNIAVDKLELVMQMEADRMNGLILDSSDIATERDVIIEERRSRTENIPSNMLFEQMRAALFLNHRYGIPLIGWHHEMAELSREDAINFYHTYYAPNNAILVVAGDITAEQLKPLAEKYYGVLPAKPIPIRHIPQEPEPISPRRVELRDDKVTRAELVRFYIAPSQLSGETVHAYPLLVLSQLLGGGETSRLYQALVKKQGLALNASSSYSDVSVGPSIFGFYVTPKEGVTLQQVEAQLNAEIKLLLDKGITDEELTHAKNFLTADAIYELDGFKTLGFIFGSALASGLGTDYVEKWPESINKVTAQQVIDAARYVLKAEKSVTGTLLPIETPTTIEKPSPRKKL